MGLFMKFLQAKLKVPNINPSTQEGEKATPVTCPVYEELYFRYFT